MRPELLNGLPYYNRATEVSEAPLYGSSLTQFEEQEQFNCNKKAEKYKVELIPVLKSLKNIFQEFYFSCNRNILIVAKSQKFIVI